MAVFNMITNPPAHLIPDADAINNKYFTVDTASLDVVHQWLNFNGHIVTYALLDGEVIGFYNLMPLTTEAGKLVERQALKEEDMRIQDILPHEALPFCQYAYLAAIAVKDTKSYTHRQCVAALMATMADHLLYGYNGEYLKKIFANPTTFQGNLMVHKLGLKPVDTMKKTLKENDIYAANMDGTVRTALAEMSQRYSRFVGDNPWGKK